jgi:hypothetical protein
MAKTHLHLHPTPINIKAVLKPIKKKYMEAA